MTGEEELRTSFRNQQEKLTYYIIALCVTSIGFSVYQTSDDPLRFSHALLGIAVLSWSFSIFFGINFIKYGLSTMYGNEVLLRVEKGLHREVGKDPQQILIASKGLREALKINVNRGAWYSRFQYFCFISGMILFLIWHVLEMYLRINR